MDPSPDSPDSIVQGFNDSRAIVSSISSKSSNQIELIKSSGLLDSAITKLYVESFRIKLQLAQATLKIIDINYLNYLKAKQKRQPKVARAHLLFIREAILASCKDQIPFENNYVISKDELVELIDVELKSLM